MFLWVLGWGCSGGEDLEQDLGGSWAPGLARGKREMSLFKGVVCAETPEETGSMFCSGFREQVCQAGAEVI